MCDTGARAHWCSAHTCARRPVRACAAWQVRVTSPDFAEQLARSRGLIASPSRGVVTQAVALGKPVYLFCPRGHIEQEYNLRFYIAHFAGVACPKTRRYRRYFGVRRVGRGRQASVTLPEGHRGALQTIAEWEASLVGLDLGDQATALRTWLGQTDEKIRERLIPLLSPSADELAAEAAERAAEEAEEAAEAAAAAAEAAEAEAVAQAEEEAAEQIAEKEAEEEAEEEEEEEEEASSTPDGDAAGMSAAAGVQAGATPPAA